MMIVNRYVVHSRRCQREAEEAVAYVLHTARSWAQLRASPAEQIWCSQVMGGRPVFSASLGRAELRLERRMPLAELLWPVHTRNVAEQ